MVNSKAEDEVLVVKDENLRPESMRRLTITWPLSEKVPSYEFEGAWDGFHIGVLIVHLHGEYRRYQESIRKEMEAKRKEELDDE